MSANGTQQSVRDSKVVSDMEPATLIVEKAPAVDFLDDGEDKEGVGLEVDGFVILPSEPKTKEEALEAPEPGPPTLTVSPWWDPDPTSYPRLHDKNERGTLTATTDNDEAHQRPHSPEPPSPATLIRQIEDAMGPLPDSTDSEQPTRQRQRLSLRTAVGPVITTASAAVAATTSAADAAAVSAAAATAAKAGAAAASHARAKAHVRKLTDSITAFVARSGQVYRSADPSSDWSSSSSATLSPPQSPAPSPAAAATPTSAEERRDSDDSSEAGEWFVTAPEEPCGEFDDFEYSVAADAGERGRGLGQEVGLGIGLGPRESALVAASAEEMAWTRAVGTEETENLDEGRARPRRQKRRLATGGW